MIKTISISQINEAIDDGYEVWIVARSSDNIKNLIDNKRIVWKPHLAPSTLLLAKANLLKKSNMWNEENWQNYYVPEFIKETLGIDHRKALNELYVASKTKKIALACFCKDASHCHRSILIGLMQALQRETEGEDFSYYWLIRRQMEQGTYTKKIVFPDIPSTYTQNTLF